MTDHKPLSDARNIHRETSDASGYIHKPLSEGEIPYEMVDAAAYELRAEFKITLGREPPHLSIAQVMARAVLRKAFAATPKPLDGEGGTPISDIIAAIRYTLNYPQESGCSPIPDADLKALVDWYDRFTKPIDREASEDHDGSLPTADEILAYRSGVPARLRSVAKKEKNVGTQLLLRAAADAMESLVSQVRTLSRPAQTCEATEEESGQALWFLRGTQFRDVIDALAKAGLRIVKEGAPSHDQFNAGIEAAAQFLIDNGNLGNDATVEAVRGLKRKI